MTAVVAGRLPEILSVLRTTALEVGRDPTTVQLIAVSKRQPAAAISAASALGQIAFGENYLQEALAKQSALAGRALEWHFIGRLQSNKTAEVAANFDWVHTVDRARTAERLNNQRPVTRGPLNVLVQVNVSGEASKGGVEPAALEELVEKIAMLPRLRLRGLMALPAPSADFEQQRKPFSMLRALAEQCSVPLKHLSMGTSDDFRAAIHEGATLVRLGTAVFGPRIA